MSGPSGQPLPNLPHVFSYMSGTCSAEDKQLKTYYSHCIPDSSGSSPTLCPCHTVKLTTAITRTKKLIESVKPHKNYERDEIIGNSIN